MKKHGTKFEHSAGGVIYRKQAGKVEILLILDKNSNWTFPKGLIEEDEDWITTAKREIAEEVGLTNLDFVDNLGTSKYFYRFEGRLIRKQVDFFLFLYAGDETPSPLAKEGIQDAQWFSADQALANIGYGKSNKEVLEKAVVIIQG